MLGLGENYVINYENNKLDQNSLNKLYDELKTGDFKAHIKWNRFQLDNCDKKMKTTICEIEELLKSNNQKLSIFPNDYLHCLLANDVYREDEKWSPGHKPLEDDKDWEVLETYNLRKIGYFGVLYMNRKKYQLVLSHR